MSDIPGSPHAPSLFGVVRRHAAFRQLWMAQVVSQMGDWFGRIAMLALLSQLAGGGAALALGLSFAIEMAVRMLPTVLLSPLAGSLADRLPRKALMVTCDLARSVLVLGYLTVDRPEELPRLYALLFAHLAFSVGSEAARQGALPNTVPRAEMPEAIALSSVTWSAMLSLGAMLGALAIQPLGLRGVFIADSASFLVSALLLARLPLPPTPPHPQPLRWIEVLNFADARRGLAHALDRGIAPVLWTKVFWGPAGGLLILLSIAASVKFAGSPEHPGSVHEVGGVIGVLLASRGIGTALGPLIGRRLLGRDKLGLLRQIQCGFWIAALGYTGFAFADRLPVAAACIVFGHLGGGALWVASTSVWQLGIADSFRGRVHSLDFQGMTLSFSAFGLLGGLTYDRTGSVRATVLLCCAAVAIGSLLWRFATRELRARAATERRDSNSQGPEALNPTRP